MMLKTAPQRIALSEPSSQGVSSARPLRKIRLRDIERYMGQSRDLRSAYLSALLVRAWRAWRLPSVFRAVPRTATLIAIFAVAGLLASGNEVSAQEMRTSAPMTDSAASDRVLLAELGLALDQIDACEEVGLLWRAVREVVLPGRVGLATQQRILRRVWAIDPDIRSGSIIESPTN